MASIKNKYEFYKGFLEALGAQDVKETEYKNEEELRKKILDTMGVEYVFDDVNQTDLFRGKFLEGLSNGGGGGGSSDFSTAKVNFIVEESITEDFLINIINVYGNDMFDALDSADIDPEGIDAVLYKGGAKVYVLQNTGVKIKEVSGAATRLDNLHANITGACTITFTIAST